MIMLNSALTALLTIFGLAPKICENSVDTGFQNKNVIFWRLDIGNPEMQILYWSNLSMFCWLVLVSLLMLKKDARQSSRKKGLYLG